MWAICLSSAASASAYFTGAYGNASCGEGERQVAQESCEAAVLDLGFFWIGDMSSGVTLSGCQTDGINGYYNSATDTQVNVRFAPICELDVSTTTTSSSISVTTTSSSRTTWTTSSSTWTLTEESEESSSTVDTTEAPTSTTTSTTSLLDVDPGGEWNILADGTLERIHSVPRRKLFTPTDVEDCPVAIATLSSLRTTFVSYVQGGSMSITDFWHDPTVAHLSLPYAWTGRSLFHPAVVTTASTTAVDNAPLDIGSVGAATRSARVALGASYLVSFLLSS